MYKRDVNWSRALIDKRTLAETSGCRGSAVQWDEGRLVTHDSVVDDPLPGWPNDASAMTALQADEARPLF